MTLRTPAPTAAPTSAPRAAARPARPTGTRRTGVSLARQTLAGLRVLLLLSLVLGLGYPLVVLGIGQVAFPWQANGSLLRADGTHATSRDTSTGDLDNPVVGSALVAQGFEGDEWFHPRPSAAGEGYDTLASAGSNLGPTSPALVATIEERRAGVTPPDTDPGSVPPDALTASGSGLDPHISPENAALQTSRVAAARGVPETTVEALVAAHTQGRDLGVLGEPRVNVLELNLALGMMSS